MMRKVSVFALITVFWLVAPDNGVLCWAGTGTVVLAEVNGQAINEGALQDRIKAIHRYRPRMVSKEGAGSIRISDLVEEMVDERLMIQEAYRVELDGSPDFAKKVESFVTSQSILRLRKEEVLEKVGISENEMSEYFKKHYEKDGPAPEGKFEKVKMRIEKKLRRQKEKELSDNFVAALRKKADISLDKELVDSVEPEKECSEKKQVVARVNGEPIFLDDFLDDLRQALHRQAGMFRRIKDDSKIKKMRIGIKEEAMDRLIMYKLIEQDALKRKYIHDPAFVDMVEKRKERLLINEFKAKIIYPLAIPTEKELTRYYEEHIDDFKKGCEVWFSEMIFQNRRDAEASLKELKQGADFEFLAARVSERWQPKRGDVWVSSDQFSPAIRKELNRLEVGQISDVVSDGRHYKIIKLKGKRGGVPIEFSKVVETLKRIVGQKKFDELLSEYLAKLRKGSKIKMNKKALKQIEEKYWNDSPGETQTPGFAG